MHNGVNQTSGEESMVFKKIQLTEKAYMDAYIADKIKDFTRKALLVIPGGAYEGVAAEREGEPIAHAFMPYGYNAFVLHYSVKDKPFPQQLIEASMAIKHIRDNCEEYNINPDAVFAVGFSAGGHLAGSLGTMWKKPEIYDAVPMPVGHNRPNGVLLIYPVISPVYHLSSFKNLLRGDVTDERLLECSIDKNVDENTCPMFIMHSSNDGLVDVRNSICLADALAEKGIKFEMHIYPNAPHGVALGNEITKCGCEGWCDASIAKWVQSAVEWAEKYGK